MTATKRKIHQRAMVAHEFDYNSTGNAPKIWTLRDLNFAGRTC